MFTSSPHRPSPPSSLLKTKRKASGTDDSSQASPSRKHPRLPALNLPQRMTFSSIAVDHESPSYNTASSPFGVPSSSSAFGGPFAHATLNASAATTTTGGGAGGMDVDDQMSSSEEGDLRTPSYPMNLAQYPFGVNGAGPLESAMVSGMDVDGSSSGTTKVGLMGPQDQGSGMHGSHCSSIPKLVLSHPNPAGHSTLWSVCRDCGATSAC